MNLENTKILYLAHGPKYNHKQVIFSVLTWLYFLDKKKEEVKIIIYTEDQAFFEKYLGIQTNINYEILTPEIMKEGKGYFDFIHRLKIWIIKHNIEKYNSNVLYLDGDTYLIKCPVSLLNLISKEKTIFHCYEYTASEGGDEHEGDGWLLFRKLVRNYEYTLYGKSFKIGMDAEMWNAGVLGIHKENHHLLNDLFDLTDQIIEKSYLKTAEQFAFSYIMAQNTKLIPAKEYIFHYYSSRSKAIYNYHIHVFLKATTGLSIEEKAKKAYELSKQHHQLKLPELISAWHSIKGRASSILKIAKKGYL
jgi:hypothetical protein